MGLTEKILRLEGFEKVFSARAFTVLAFRVGTSWTKKDLEKVVAYLDKFEYFSMFRLVCTHLSNAAVFGPGPSGQKAAHIRCTKAKTEQTVKLALSLTMVLVEQTMGQLLICL